MRYETETIRTPDGLDLFVHHWLPAAAPRAQVVLVHGYAEHAGRYAHLAAFLNLHGIAVHGFDLRGHGKSGGKQAYIDRFELYLKDLTAVLDRVRMADRELPVFLYGHSMGGGIVTWYVISRQPEFLRGVLLTGPMLKISDDISPVMQQASSVLGEWLPKLKTIKLDSKAVSRDPKVVEAYEQDPMVYTGSTYARTGAEMIGVTRRIQANMEKFRLPVLIMHGTADRLTDPEGSKMLESRATAADKALKLFPGLYHELINEPEKEEVMKEMLIWMEERL